MGMDLVGESGAEFRTTGSGWTYYLNLAEEYGWKPAGTRRPRGLRMLLCRWSGGYDTNDGARVTARDAAAMATALEAALADPDRSARRAVVAVRVTEGVRAVMGAAQFASLVSADASYVLELPEDDAEHLRKLIGFLRSGGFEIF